MTPRFEVHSFEQVPAGPGTVLLRIAGRWVAPTRERLPPPPPLRADGRGGPPRAPPPAAAAARRRTADPPADAAAGARRRRADGRAGGVRLASGVQRAGGRHR